jgi:hypothetical protein
MAAHYEYGDITVGQTEVYEGVEGRQMSVVLIQSLPAIDCNVS